MAAPGAAVACTCRAFRPLCGAACASHARSGHPRMHGSAGQRPRRRAGAASWRRGRRRARVLVRRPRPFPLCLSSSASHSGGSVPRRTWPDAGRASSGVRGDGLVSRFYKTVAVVRAPQVRALLLQQPRSACPACLCSAVAVRLTHAFATQGDGWQLTLDGRTLRSPAKAPLVFPTHALALAVAAEWEWQDATNIRPFTMPLMARVESPELSLLQTIRHPPTIHKLTDAMCNATTTCHRACAAPPLTASPRPGGPPSASCSGSLRRTPCVCGPTTPAWRRSRRQPGTRCWSGCTGRWASGRR